MSFLSDHSIGIRVLLALLGVFGVVFAPPWVPLLVILLLALCYPAWEALAIGLMADLLWQTPTVSDGLFGALPLMTLAALLFVWGFEPLRREFLT